MDTHKDKHVSGYWSNPDRQPHNCLSFEIFIHGCDGLERPEVAWSDLASYIGCCFIQWQLFPLVNKGASDIISCPVRSIICSTPKAVFWWDISELSRSVEAIVVTGYMYFGHLSETIKIVLTLQILQRQLRTPTESLQIVKIHTRISSDRIDWICQYFTWFRILVMLRNISLKNKRLIN